MSPKRKEQIHSLLKGIETGDPESVAVVNPDKYIQHNPQTHEGGEGLAALFKRLSKTNPRVNIARIFSDGDYVFAHTEYDFASRRIGFEIFRFEKGFAVEHWDNIQARKGPNFSGHSMVSGPSTVEDLDRTESNRDIVSSFVEHILIKKQLDKLDSYVDKDFIQHNPELRDGLPALRSALENPSLRYELNHRILAEGCFVLSVSQGAIDGVATSFYDLFRVVDEKLVEHWDTIEAIPSCSEWKNDNGKF